jgi:2-polyprenyl-3-methyl-5-hydroxy-6-metoxy-1,4-benzoquinol methylase
MQTLQTLDELDTKLRQLDDDLKVSDSKLREGFNTFRMDFAPPVATDPDSEQYRNEQFAIYERIAGRPYSTSSERTSFCPLKAADRPFPYSTQGPDVIGDQLIAIGSIIKTMALPPGARILEFGPGWGNTTIALARAGYDVTCIEIEQNFVDLIQERARRCSVNINTIRGDFLDAANLTGTFDAVLFFESFHHCAKHNDLLDLLGTLVAPDGQIMFAAEPITQDFHAPWGIRSDGQTLWAIRNFGWLELGFSESYFRNSLHRRGWHTAKRSLEMTQLGHLFVARRGSPSTQRSVRLPKLAIRIARALHRRLDRMITRLDH